MKKASCRNPKFLFFQALTAIITLNVAHAGFSEEYDKVFDCSTDLFNTTEFTIVLSPGKSSTRYKIDNCLCRENEADATKMMIELCESFGRQAQELTPEKAQFWRYNPTPWGFMELETGVKSWSYDVEFTLPENVSNDTVFHSCYDMETLSSYLTKCVMQVLQNK